MVSRMMLVARIHLHLPVPSSSGYTTVVFGSARSHLCRKHLWSSDSPYLQQSVLVLGWENLAVKKSQSYSGGQGNWYL